MHVTNDQPLLLYAVNVVMVVTGTDQHDAARALRCIPCAPY